MVPTTTKRRGDGESSPSYGIIDTKVVHLWTEAACLGIIVLVKYISGCQRDGFTPPNVFILWLLPPAFPKPSRTPSFPPHSHPPPDSAAPLASPGL